MYVYFINSGDSAVLSIPWQVLYNYLNLVSNYIISNYIYIVSVKMNMLLYAPGLLMLYLLALGIKETILCLAICASIQLLISLEFLSAYPYEYISRAFEFSRVFIYKWTVNYKFLSEEFFVDKRLSIALLLCTIIGNTYIYMYRYIYISFKNFILSNSNVFICCQVGERGKHEFILFRAHIYIVNVYVCMNAYSISESVRCSLLNLPYPASAHISSHSLFFHPTLLVWHLHGLSIINSTVGTSTRCHIYCMPARCPS